MPRSWRTTREPARLASGLPRNSTPAGDLPTVPYQGEGRDGRLSPAISRPARAPPVPSTPHSTSHLWRPRAVPNPFTSSRASTDDLASGADALPVEPGARRVRTRRGGPRTPLPLLPVIAV